MVAWQVDVIFRFLPLVALCLSVGTATARADIVWETNYDTARAKSVASGKPLFVDVYTDWCGWCKKLDSSVYPDPRVQQMAGNFVMLKLNAEAGGASFARAMRVTGYPTLLLATSRGQEIARRGYVEPDEFLAVLSDALRRNGPPKPVRASTRKTAPARTAIRRTSAAPRHGNWKTQPELRRALQRSNYSGVYVLDERGAVALDQPNSKKAKRSKKR